MARVSITINANTYDIACPDGEEQNILDLALGLDAKVAELVGAIGQAGEARLLAMAGLLMADEMAEVKSEVERLRVEALAVPEPAPAPPAIDENRLADVLDALAARMESIADRVENA